MINVANSPVVSGWLWVVSWPGLRALSLCLVTAMLQEQDTFNKVKKGIDLVSNTKCTPEQTSDLQTGPVSATLMFMIRHGFGR